MADPSAGLIISGIRTVGTAAWKGWNKWLAHKETGELLRSAPCWAVCPVRHEAKEVRRLAASLEQRLRKTAIPAQKLSLLGHAKRLGRSAIWWRARSRQRPPMTVFGDTFSEHLQGWLRAAVVE